MVQAYWQIGRIIVEHEQNGKIRAEYGKSVLKELSVRLTKEFGKGFEDDNPTIGIILCSQKNEAIVKYSVLSEAKQVFASKYRFTLPTVEELQQEIERERKIIEEQKTVVK